MCRTPVWRFAWRVAPTFHWLITVTFTMPVSHGAELAPATNGESAYAIVLPAGDLWSPPVIIEGAPVLVHAIDPKGKMEPGSDRDAELEAARALRKDRKWAELIEHFAKADFSGWPDEQAAEALSLRGSAYAVLKKGKEAEADFKAALKLMPRLELTWLALADNYRDVLNDDERALETYRHLLTLVGGGNGWLPIQTTLSIARVLTDHGKTDEALAMLKRYGNMDGMHPVWRVKMLRTYGHVYAAQGKEAESLAAFRAALELEAKK